MRGITTALLLVSFIQFSLAQCLLPTAFDYLDVNNARVGIRNDGNIWTNGQDKQYEVPAGFGRHAMFRGGLWIGGLNANGGLHLAAKAYGSLGYDFYPGPLDSNGETDQNTCMSADRIFKLNRYEVDQFRFLYDQPGYIIPLDILQWPANGNPFAEFHAEAPFVDVNNDQLYNPQDGDYPAFSFDGTTDVDHDLLGDQCLWWVMNDKGGPTGLVVADPFGIQIQCMAYAFSTCDELNDQTLYRYTVTNKSSESYHDVVIGQFSDTEVGAFDDDYVGSDVMRSLAFSYNADAVDGFSGTGLNEYPDNPPAIGVDILRGPMADANDGVDNDRDGTIDEPDEHLVMSNFISFSNASVSPPPPSFLTDPGEGSEFYNYLNGIWRDGTHLCYGGIGHPDGGCSGNMAEFLYPGDSDPEGFGTGMVPQQPWTEESSNNPPGDRRMLSGVGPFTMMSGETEILHFAALFAWDQFGPEPYSSVEQLKDVSDLVQGIFDSDFDDMGCCEPVANAYLYQFDELSYLFVPQSSGYEYFWDFGDGTTSTEPYPAHEYAVPGEYEVCLTVSNDCGSDQFCGNVSLLVQNIDEQAESELKIFPNPSNGLFTVRHSTLQSLRVYSTDGRLVFSDDSAMQLGRMDISDQSPGIYFVVVETDNGFITRKYVKQ